MVFSAGLHYCYYNCSTWHVVRTQGSDGGRSIFNMTLLMFVLFLMRKMMIVARFIYCMKTEKSHDPTCTRQVVCDKSFSLVWVLLEILCGFVTELRVSSFLSLHETILKGYKYVGPRFTTLDRRNPAQADIVNIPSCAGFYSSQVVQDFFHQQ